MDTALILRISHENHLPVEEDEILRLLRESILVGRLTADWVQSPLSAVFRIVGLSEIPYAERLPYTRRLIDFINREIATPKGFSCLGGVTELVPCYNAMLLESYCRLGLVDTKEAQSALGWITQYQLFERGQTTTWPYKGICKHGGCLGKTPCYIGIGKTVRALITYLEFKKMRDAQVEALLEKGIRYLLRHNMYRRLTDGAPISRHITDILFPQSYALSLTDLVYIAGKRRLLREPGCAGLLDLLRKKQVGENQWKIDFIYRYPGYVGFESRRTASEWASALFPLWLKDPQS